MAHFQEMDPNLIRELIKDESNVIDLAVEVEREVYKNTRCPKCGATNLAKKTDAPKIVMEADGPKIISSPFSSNNPITNGFAQCQECGTEFCPGSGVIRAAGTYITSVQRPGPHQE